MKVTSEFLAADCGNPGFPVANLQDPGIGDRELHSLEGTTEFEPFRRMFFDLDPLVSEDELILQLSLLPSELLNTLQRIRFLT
jgi:hypothetical protein